MSRKKDAEGFEKRRLILGKYLPGRLTSDLWDKAKELKCNPDDLLDAVCLAVTAALSAQGLCETIPEKPQMNENGLYMKLTLPKPDV